MFKYIFELVHITLHIHIILHLLMSTPLENNMTEELSESTIEMLCKYFDVTSLDSEEVKDMHKTYRKYNKSPSTEEISTAGSKHYYHNLYRIYIENIRPRFRRYVITTIYNFAFANLHSGKDALVITYDRTGARKSVKMVTLPEEICIVHHSLSFDMKTLFVDVAYMQKPDSPPDTVIMTLESMIEKEERLNTH
jgi:hypothetical protein